MKSCTKLAIQVSAWGPSQCMCRRQKTREHPNSLIHWGDWRESLQATMGLSIWDWGRLLATFGWIDPMINDWYLMVHNFIFTIQWMHGHKVELQQSPFSGIGVSSEMEDSKLSGNHWHIGVSMELPQMDGSFQFHFNFLLWKSQMKMDDFRKPPFKS